MLRPSSTGTTWRAMAEGATVSRDRRQAFDRREFLRRSGRAGLLLPAAPALLAACARPGTTVDPGAVGTGGLDLGGPYPIATPEHPVTWTIFEDNPPIADGLRPEQGATLEIFIWDAYLWKKVVQDFCAAYDCDYRITTFTNMDEALAKVRTGELRFDVFFPTTDTFGKLISSKLLQPLNRSYLPNLDTNVWPVYGSPYYDGESRYSVPYVVYSTGIGYRRDAIPDATFADLANPYDILWDPTHAGRVGVYDSYRDTMGEVLLRRGITDVNTGRAEDLQLVEDDLLALTDAVGARTSTNGAFELLPQNQFDLHTAWSGDMIASWFYVDPSSSYEDLGYWFPQDRRGLVGSDAITIPANAEHPVLAHRFLNHLLEPGAALKNFSWTGYQPPQNDADPDSLTTTISPQGEPYVFPWMEAAIVRPEDFDLGVGVQLTELTPEVDDRWHDVWQRFQLGVS